MKTRVSLTAFVFAAAFGGMAYPAAAGTSACCHADQSCTSETAEECAFFFPGVFFPGESCEEGCFGACKLPDGRCADTDAWSCKLQGGSLAREAPCCLGNGPFGLSACGDNDNDGDLDENDWRKMIQCLSGPGVVMSDTCRAFNLVGDNRIDLKDFSVFAIRFQPQAGCKIEGVLHGPNEQAPPPRDCRSCKPQWSRSTWTKLGFGEVCRRGSGDLCDPDEYCDGFSDQCGEDNFLPSGTTCRFGSGEYSFPTPSLSRSCDPDEVCPEFPTFHVRPILWNRSSSLVESIGIRHVTSTSNSAQGLQGNRARLTTSRRHLSFAAHPPARAIRRSTVPTLPVMGVLTTGRLRAPRVILAPGMSSAPQTLASRGCALPAAKCLARRAAPRQTVLRDWSVKAEFALAPSTPTASRRTSALRA